MKRQEIYVSHQNGLRRRRRNDSPLPHPPQVCATPPTLHDPITSSHVSDAELLSLEAESLGALLAPSIGRPACWPSLDANIAAVRRSAAFCFSTRISSLTRRFAFALRRNRTAWRWSWTACYRAGTRRLGGQDRSPTQLPRAQFQQHTPMFTNLHSRQRF